MRGKRSVAVAIVVMMIANLVGVKFAPPAFASDPGIDTIVNTLNGASNSLQQWSQGLATVSKLADALPAVQTSPGSVLGFADLLSQAFSNGAKKISTATTDGDLNINNESISLSASRAGHLSSTLTTLGNGDKQVDLTVDVAKTVHDQPLNVNVPIGSGSNAPQSAFSSQGGVDLTVNIHLGIRAVWDSASDTVYFVVNNTTPALTVDSTATIANAANMSASIGILGVKLMNDSSLSLSANLKATVSDPNNDGRVAFTNTDHTPGELAQAGSLAGLVTFGFDSPAGALNASLHLNAAPATSFSLSLPAIDATIAVAWPDISTGSPSVTPTGIGTAGKFLNLTPRDLADGLGQLVTSLTDISRAKIGALGNLDLPFLKGTLADAVQINEALKKFLKDNTVDPTTDPAKAGAPLFTSLQDLLDRLNTATSLPGGATIGIGNVNYDDPTSKLSFKVTLHRDAPSTPVDLNQAAAAASGGAGTTYTTTTLKDPNQHWTADEWKDRHVVAGSAGGTIVSNTADTLTIASPGWSPVTPHDGDPYAISGMQGDVGVVELGNSLQQSGHGVATANAVNATAKVKPSYDAFVTLVLDLEDPVMHDPPLEVDNGDGTTHLESATPIAADRIMIRTGASNTSFTADFPITAGVDLFANAGFLQVELKGNVAVCQTNAGSDCSGTPGANDHMLSVGLKDNGDLTFGQIVHDILNDPGSLLDYQVHVRGTGSVTASIPNAPDFFPSSASASFHWNDLTQTTGTDGPQFDTSGLSDLVKFDFDPSNPKQLFSIILKTLQTLDQAIGNANPSGASIFNTKIPVVGRSLGDLLKSDESGMGDSVTYGSDFVQDTSRDAQHNNTFPQSLVGRSIVAGTQVGIVKTVTSNKLTLATPWTTTPAAGTPYTMRSELDDIVSILQNSPSDNLQALIKLVNDRMGPNSPVSFAFKEDASVGNTPSLIINLDWKRSFHTSAPVQFNFNLPIGDQKLAGVQGQGLVSLGASGEIKIGLVVALQAGEGPADASALKILNDSKISVGLDASVDNASLATTIGPLSLSLGNPKSNDPADKAKAKANYSLDLAKSGADGSAETFADFLGEVGPTINASSQAVDCGLGGSTDLALCATLPLYISDDGGNTYTQLIDTSSDPTKSDSFTIRLPKSTTPDSDYFDLSSSAAQIDGHDRLETPTASDLADAIQQHLIDLARLDGIDGFMNLLEQSLNAASFGGKLPLIGDDLQQGANFIGSLKQTIDSALGSLAGVNSISGLRDWVNNQLAAQLQTAGLNPDLVKVDTQCSTSLDSAGAPTVTPTPTGGGQTISYAVVSYVKDSSGNEHDATPSPEGQTTDGPATIDGSHTVGVTWTAVTGAAGYKVYRNVSGSLKLLKDVGTSTSYTDSGADTPGDGPTNASGANPKLTDCDYSNFDSVLIRLDVSQGNFSGDFLQCQGAPSGHECTTKSVPLDIGIPGLSLRAADPSQGPSVELGWRLHLAFGISRSEGFFVDTKDGDPQPEFAVGMNFTLPAEMQAQLAFINITAKNCDKTMTQDCKSDAPAPGNIPPLFGGTFKIDLKAPNDPTNGHLTLQDLADANLSDLFDVKLNAGLNIDWLLKATVGQDAGFPGIQAEFRMSWNWSNVAPSTDSSSSGGNTPLAIEFDKVQIDAGAVFGSIVGPIINEIKKVTGPLDPIIKTLYAPIPVLSDLSHLVGGDDVTIISIAKAFSTIAGGPDLSFIDTITQVIQVINAMPSGSNHVLIPLGDFTLFGDKALNNPATPDNSASMIDQQTLDPGASGSDGILGSLDTNDGNGSHIMKGNGSDPAPTKKAGFEFPVFEHPSSLFNVLLGGDVTLVTFDSGPLTLGFDWRQEFGPVYAPPPVLITLHGSASVTLHIKAGFDTYGLRKAFDAARAGTLDLSTVGDAILQSLFFATTDDSGKPLPVVQFTGELAAGAEVSAVVITVGIEGGVGLTVSFLWNDPNHDGKFRISEFLQAALNNPICLFSVSGRLFVFLKLYVTIGVSIFSVTFSFTIVDVTLLDFSAAPDCSPPPPKLGGLADGGKTLVIYAAALGHAAERGDPSYESNNEDKDTVKVTELHDYTTNPPTFKGIGVEMLGIRNEFLNTNIERVVVDGRGYDKPMSVTFLGDGKADTSKTGSKPPTASFDKDAMVFGGNANDVIKTGIGNSWVDGGPGDDLIVTGDRTVLTADKSAYVRPDAVAWVAGGGGKDSITVGNGPDYVAGDETLDAGHTVTLTDVLELKNSKDPKVNVDSGNPTEAAPNLTIPDWTKLNQPNGTENHSTDNDDIVNVGLGASTVFGDDGNDTLSVGADDPLAKSRPSQLAMFTSAGATLVGGNGSDHFAGGTGPDKIYTGPKSNTTIDGDGPVDNKGANDPGAQPASINIVDTGTGSDTVYGATGIDRVTGHSLPPRPDPANTSNTLPAQTDDIRGGSNDDILIGGYGTDKIYGGPGQDYVIAEPSNVDTGSGTPPDLGFGPEYGVTHNPLPSGVAPAHKTLVGGLGNDHIIGGDGGADVYGDKQTTPCKAGNPVASDPVDESVDTPQDGNDKITGGAGVENVRAGGGDDNVDVKGNDDLACGEKGNDVLQGGSGNDQVWGGSGNDTVYGDTGSDSLYGNDGNDAVYGGEDGDTIEGNNGTDQLFGGGASDLIVGGTQAAARPDQGDFIYGDTGDDTIIGDNGTGTAGAAGTPYDVDGANASYGGADLVFAGAGADHAYGGLADDYVFGGTEDDYIEGNNGADHLFGEAGQDDIIGGTSQVKSGTGLSMVGYPDANDTISGGADQDAVLGDNGSIVRDGVGSPFTQARGMTLRTMTPYDWSPADSTVYGNDTITGDGANDAILGEGGSDTIDGNEGDDYIEGNQGADTVYGDAGQDDIVGGSSQAVSGSGLSTVGEPDSGDTLLSGGDNQDVILGDNGSILRTSLTGATTVTGTLEDVTKGHAGMSQRRISLYDIGATSPGGGDTIQGDSADDALFGQVGSDTINGNGGDDYIEGDQGADVLHGDAGQDDILGGTTVVASGNADAQTAVGEPDTGDVITGDVDGQTGGDQDVILGDNGSVLRIGASNAANITNTPDDAVKGHAGTTARRIRLFDLSDAAAATLSGADDISAQGGDDAVFGQGGNDRIKGGLGDDHLEGGQAADFVEGDGGDDDVIGGSSIILSGVADNTAQGLLDQGDVLYGGDGNDVVTGDNAVVDRVGGTADSNYTTKFTNRLNVDGSAVMTTRWLRRLDLSVGAAKLLGNPAGRYGDDRISGGKGVDTLFGQDGNDAVSGGPDDDYIEGGAGNDTIRGDKLLTDAVPTNTFPPAGPPATADQVVAETTVAALVDNWVGTAGSAADLEGPAGNDGQDDILGGTSLQGFRDGNDAIEGDGESDFQLGDNGALVRDFGAPDGNGIRHYTVYTKRYPTGSVPANATVVRHNDPTIAGMTTTRFCVSSGTTCEVAGAFGNDTMYGDGGDDTMWGQDGNDTMRGGAGNDDMYGELGDDAMYGDSGQDAMLGDRGGIVDTWVNGSGDASNLAPYSVSVQAPPAITYNAFIPGTYDRRVDMLHDINGASFVGSGAGAVMPHDGVSQGGNDHMRGGGGHDNLHAGYGDDVLNGDSGGDTLYGDDGADVMWGGKGCDPLSAEDFNGTCTDPATDRGPNDMFVDYEFGGKGGTSQISLKGDVGSDIMDWQPRGSYPSNCATAPWPQTVGSTTIDPCDWFLMTNTYNDPAGSPSTDPAHADNQTHHGIDWMYGGWDRDVMQADQADEGPNTGDRLLDWNGAYNLYSHCNPSYGGYNDVRQLSPAEQAFMQQWSYGTGIGQQASDVTTSGTSAFDELALVYQSDMKAHGTGPDYPTTPGHFDSPNACTY